MSDDEFTERKCPLYVIRKKRRTADDAWVLQVEQCGHPLHVHYEESRAFLWGGEMGTCGQTWSVVCENGHVLVLPDHDADDNFEAIPFDVTLVNQAIERTRPWNEPPDD